MDFDSLTDDSAISAQPPQNTPQPQAFGDFQPTPDFDSLTDDSEKYGTPAQQAITALEGIGQGVAGPLAPMAEKMVGVPEEDIVARAKENPIAKGTGQATGLVGGMLTGTGEAALMGAVGKGAVEAAGLAKATGLGASIARGAVQQAAEMLVLQGGDEVSRMIVHDPESSAESAIANIGLATAIGGVTGAALGSISPLWKAAVGNKVTPILEDMKGRLNFRMNNPDLPSAVTKELQDLHNNVTESISNLYSEGEGGIKANQIAAALPEVTPKATERINGQITEVLDKMVGALDDIRGDVKVGGKAGYLAQDLENFVNVVDNPEAKYADKFNALDGLKKTLQGYSKYGQSVEDTAFGSITKKLAAEIRPGLEDTSVWGKAADIQTKINKAISEFLPAQKDMTSKFTTKLLGDQVIDPSKVNTYLNQIGKPSAEIKQEVVKNYLDRSNKLIGTINDLFTKEGLEAPFPHTSTSVLTDSIGKKTAGSVIIDKLIDKQLQNVLGETLGGTVGSTIGGVLGHPGIGFLAGEHALGPMFSSVLPPLINPVAANKSLAPGIKSAIDYGMAVFKGQEVLTKASAAVFKSGAQVLTSRIPDAKSREKLDKTVEHFQDTPNAALNVDNGRLGHYLPNNQTALSASSTRAITYLQTLKPHSYRPGPLDKEIEPSNAQVQRYNRALDIAQSPLIVLDHAKNGVLQASDIKDLQAMYPALYKQITQKISKEMINAHSEETAIPYKTRMGLSLLLGQALDTSMQPASIQAAQPQIQPQPPIPQTKPTRRGAPSKLGKTAPMYQTPDQASEARKLRQK